MQRETIDHQTVAKAVKQARKEGHRLVVRDAKIKAFALRVGSSGAISYTYQYRDSNGAQRLYTLPESECETPHTARAFAEKLRNRVREDGFDPLRDRILGRERQQAEQATGHTIAELCDTWIAARKDKRSLRSDCAIIKVHVKPRLGHLRVDEIRRKDVAEAMRAIGIEAAKLYQANRFHSLVSSLLNFAGNGVSGHEGLHWLGDGAANVARGIPRFHEEPRDQNLTPDQMARLLAAIDKRQDTTPGRQIRLLMLTLARMNEVLGARWNEFALETSPGFWIKPAARMKAKKTVRVPVVGGALKLLREMKAARVTTADDGFLFPGRDHGHGSLRRCWLKITREANLPELHTHDLRHVGATVLASSGVPLFVVARLLGHSTTSRVTERYSHLQDHAAAAAMERIGDHYRNVTAIGIEAAK